MALIPFNENASVSLMALSVSDVSVCLAVSFVSKRKKEIWSLSGEMNTLCVIFSVHRAETLSVIATTSLSSDH